MNEFCEYCGKKKCKNCKGNGGFDIYVHDTSISPYYSHREICKTCDGKGFTEKSNPSENIINLKWR